MSKNEVLAALPEFRVLLEVKNGFHKGYYVPIDHRILDGLVGRLLQLADLTADAQQRQALKSEIKHRCRDWLDSEYKMNGYDMFKMQENPTGKVIEIK